jgi:PPIC-type PPIASE domain
MPNRSHIRFFPIVALLLLAGCGGGHAHVAATSQDAAIPAPARVPAGAVAIVGSTPITVASFEHWLPIVQQGVAAEGTAAAGRKQAGEATVSFLVRAEWLLQESGAEGINETVLNRLVSQQTAHGKAENGMTRADVAYRARLAIITEALQSRHSDTAASVSGAQVAHYYAAHRAQFVNPPVRDTLMVVTHSLARALKARAALGAGQRWAAVAKRYSVDSSALIGGAFAVVGGEQSPALERAVFTAERGRTVGPVKAPPAAGAPVATYYLFEVTGARPGSPQLVSEVAAQIKQTLTQQLQQRSWAAFSGAYDKRWTARTLCAPGYVVAECRNAAAATTRGREP